MKKQRANLALIKPEALPPEALEEKRQAIISRAVAVAEEIVDILLEEARGGSVQAAKLLLQVGGLLPAGGPTIATQVNTQFTITPEELERLEKALYEE